MAVFIPLFLSDIAGSELLLVLFFVLMFFGAKSIPSMARSLGKVMQQVKNASADVQNEIKKSGVDIKKDLNLKEIIKETQDEIAKPLDQAMTDVENAIHYEPKKRNVTDDIKSNQEKLKEDNNG
ncbi:MAG: twin-arginine translocase TatA/TatE family subunit [Crocinitomicaceae bacterium]|nr:twin-arginine translocase TatA/TatE family subunit [Crocinitomicaceae bacterium]